MSSLSLPSPKKRMEPRFSDPLLWQFGSFLKTRHVVSLLQERRCESLTLQAFDTKAHAVSCEGRRDADFERIKAFTHAIARAKTKWLDDVYSSKQLHLRILGTRPDYQGVVPALSIAGGV